MGKWRYSSTIIDHFARSGGGAERPALHLGRFTPGPHWIGGWVGPRAGLDAVKKRKIFPCRRIEIQPTSPQPIAVPTELSHLLLLSIFYSFNYIISFWVLSECLGQGITCNGYNSCTHIFKFLFILRALLAEEAESDHRSPSRSPYCTRPTESEDHPLKPDSTSKRAE
jgi:hypothetical protein